MSLYKSLFKQTAIYGLATVLPRLFSFLLTPLYTDPSVLSDPSSFGSISIIFSWIVLFNVVLAYGMETAFFRFYSSESTSQQRKVLSTSTISLFWSSLVFLFIAIPNKSLLSEWTDIEPQYIGFTVWILVLDALVIIPFSKLRSNNNAILYAIIKIGNVALNLLLNVFFLLVLPKLALQNPDGYMASIYVEDNPIAYVLISNIIASLLTFLVLIKHYIKVSWHFDFALWKKMIRYAIPVLIAGIAFSVNETFDRILLDYLLPSDIAKSEVGAYSACYKIALFMTLFATAFRLGIEPFFFNYAKNEDAPVRYAFITKYFVIIGSFILLAVVISADLFKLIIVRNPVYWEAMKIVPLIVMANFFLGIYHNLSVWYKLTDRTFFGAVISIIGAVMTITLNIWLIPEYSYFGSAIATAVVYGAMMLISYWLGNKYYPIPYDLKGILPILLSSVILSCVYFYYFRENYWIGMVFLLLFAYFVYRSERLVVNQLLAKSKHGRN